MNRRSFFCRFLAVGLAPFAAKADLRIIEKQTGPNFQRCRMHTLRKGDVFRYADKPNELWRANSWPYLSNEGYDDGIPRWWIIGEPQ